MDEATGEGMDFEGDEVTRMESRKIMVEFPPLPHPEGEETKPVMFVDTDESIKVNIVFQANPPPTDNEVSTMQWGSLAFWKPQFMCNLFETFGPQDFSKDFKKN